MNDLRGQALREQMARNQGHWAHQRNESVRSNPYAPGTRESACWLVGYGQALKYAVGREVSRR